MAHTILNEFKLFVFSVLMCSVSAKRQDPSPLAGEVKKPTP